MDNFICLQNASVHFPREAPMITAWIGKEMERWIQMNYQLETTVEITFKTEKKEDDRFSITEAEQGPMIQSGGGDMR